MNTTQNIHTLQAALEETLTAAQRTQLQALLLLVRSDSGQNIARNILEELYLSLSDAASEWLEAHYGEVVRETEPD